LEEWDNFNVEEPEDLLALEEMYYGELSKCRGKGKKKRDKFKVEKDGVR